MCLRCAQILFHPVPHGLSYRDGTLPRGELFRRQLFYSSLAEPRISRWEWRYWLSLHLDLGRLFDDIEGSTVNGSAVWLRAGIEAKDNGFDFEIGGHKGAEFRGIDDLRLHDNALVREVLRELAVLDHLVDFHLTEAPGTATDRTFGVGDR